MGEVLLDTPRLRVSRFAGDDPADDAFVLELLNDDDFLRHIGDRGVHTLADARAYLLHGPVASYAAHGHGLFRVSLRETGIRVGMCGLVRRAALLGPDLGYAFLPGFRGRGLAAEAAAAVMRHAHQALGIAHVLAITDNANAASIRLLLNLQFRHDGEVRLGEDQEPLGLYAWTAAS